MADSFNDPKDQASLDALRAKLDSVVGELQAAARAAEEQLSRDSAARKESLAEKQTAARGGGEGRVIEDTSAASIRSGTGAVDERIGAEETLNDLIRQRIELEARAAAAARAGGAPTGSNSLLAAAGARAQVAKPSVAAGGVGTPIVPGSAPGTTDQLAQSLERERRALADLDDSLTRHGALTTEFLGALGRGEVTLREFGDQMLQTIGKFGGWTAAAAGVYGALAALNEIKKGAIDTESAIQGLTRFIPNLNKPQAQQSIIANAQETVTPVADVGTAAQSFARIFKNQGDVFTATHVALTATKLDNIQLADSYRYLTALTQEYGLQANQLPGVFDQITAAQDRLGARVSELLPAIARSAAAIKNTGGDLNQALALESLTIVRTGQTGNTIGTGFSRGASNFYKTPANQQVLKQFGIDPSQGFTQALIEAIQKSQGLGGDQKRELSKAFFGPLRGGQLASLFNASPEQLQKFIGQTSPDSSRGLAQKQLATVTSQADQRIKELGIDLQGLGASLASSGLLTDLGVLVSLLNSFLQATTQLLQAYNTLPGAVKEGAGAILGIAAAAAALRRFGVIDSVGAFRKSESAYLGSTIGSLSDDQRGLARRGSSQASETAYLARERDAALVAGDEEAAASYEAAMRASYQKQVEIAARRESIQAEITGLQSQLTTIEGATRAELIAERERIAGLGAGAGAATAGEGVAAAETGQTTATTRAVASTEALTAAIEQLAVAEEVVVAETEVVDATFATTLVAGLGTAATAVKSFVLGLGGLAIAAGAYAAFHGADELNKQASQYNNGIAQANTPKAVHDEFNKLNATNPQGLSGQIEQTLAGGPNLDLLKSQLQEAQGRLNELGATATAKNVGEARLSQIQAQLNTSLASAKDDFERVAAIKKALAELGTDKALQFVAPNEFKAAKAGLTRQLDSVSTSKNSIRNYVDSLKTAKDLENYSNETQTIFDIQGPSSQEGFKRASATMARIAELMKGSLASADLTTFVTDWKKAQEQIKQAANQQLSNSLTLAGTDPNAQSAARTTYLDQLKQPIAATRAEYQSISAQLRDRQKKLAAARAELAAVDAYPQTVPSSETNLKDQIGKLSAAAGQSKQIATRLKQLLDQQLQDYKVAQEQMAQANEQARVALIDAQGAYAVSGTQDPAAQAQINYQTAAKDLAALTASGIKDPVQRLQLLTKLRDAQNQAVDAALTQWEANQKLAVANTDIGAPQGAQLQEAVTAAQQTVDHIRALGSSVSPDKLIQALTDLATARSALVDYERQQARALIDAQGSLAQSQTNDPVQVARDALATAQRLLAFDQKNGATQADLTKDQADVNSKRQALQKSIYDQQLSNITFRASVQDINQQTELDQLQALLKRMQKSHAAIADIQNVEKQIYDLEHNLGSNLDLNVGNIKLPSLYEVRSAIASGRNASKRRAATDALAKINNNVNMTVTISKDVDLRKFTDALGDALHGNVQGIAQAAGLI